MSGTIFFSPLVIPSFDKVIGRIGCRSYIQGFVKPQDYPTSAYNRFFRQITVPAGVPDPGKGSDRFRIGPPKRKAGKIQQSVSRAYSPFHGRSRIMAIQKRNTSLYFPADAVNHDPEHTRPAVGEMHHFPVQRTHGLTVYPDLADPGPVRTMGNPYQGRGNVWNRRSMGSCRHAIIVPLVDQ